MYKAATWDGEDLRLDDGTLLRARAPAPTRVYVVGSCPLRAIGLRYGGELTASQSGELRQLAFGGYQIRPAVDLVGEADLPTSRDRLAQIPQLVRRVTGAGGAPTTATGVALSLARRCGVAPTRYPLGDLARAWLRMWFDAGQQVVQQGPQVLVKSGGADVVEYDLRAAYLRGLRERMGVGMETKIPAGLEQVWADHAEETGLIDADVAVRCDRAIPPLPVRRGGVTLWPVGAFRWVGPISTLRAAVQAGEAIVVRVRGGFYFRSRSTPLARLADAIAAIPDDEKWLRKLLYTRAYGALASTGVRAKMDASTPLDTPPIWTIERPDPDAPRVWRPDWAAEVAGLSLRELHASMRLLPPGRQVVYSHVDAVWVEGGAAPSAFPERLYAAKARGDWRGYGVGWFDHAGRRARAGVPEGADPRRVQAGVASATWRARLWSGRPWETDDAASAAPWLDELETGVAPPPRHAMYPVEVTDES